jgi:hypothetical protein
MLAVAVAGLGFAGAAMALRVGRPSPRFSCGRGEAIRFVSSEAQSADMPARPDAFAK